MHPGVSYKEIGGKRPHQYKLWDSDKLDRACTDVKKGSLSIRRAELEYGIPRSTIHDYVSGNRMLGQPGHRRYLSNEEESELVRFLIGCSNVGYARSRKQILALVESYLTEVKGCSISLTNGWWEKFKSRHPDLSVRTAERLAYSRAVASNSTILESYLEMLQRTLEEYNILDVPSQVFNCDESGFPLDFKAPKVVAEKGSKASYHYYQWG